LALVIRGLHQKSVLTIDHELGERAVRERHEGCAAGKRLQRDQRTCLSDQTWYGETARGSEQPPFAPEAERAEIAALPIEAWPDLLIEVLQMLGGGKERAPAHQRRRRQLG